jgi:uncharacterized protein (DUF1501 family)
MSTTRREFLNYGCSAAIASMAGSRILELGFSPNVAVKGDQILVVVFLRGGLDGLHFLAPVDDKDYVAARPANLRVASSGDEKGLEIARGPADFDFRLHKSAGAIKELYDSEQLAFIHACGLTNATRSHFEAMDFLERGVEGQEGRAILSGWITRLVADLPGDAQLKTVSAADRTPDSMLGHGKAVAMTNPEAFSTPGGEKIETYLRRLYSGPSSVHQAGSSTLDAIRELQSKLKDKNGEWIKYEPENKASYPDGELGNSLKTVSRLVKAEMGLQVAAVDYGGWDTHEGQVYTFGPKIDHMAKSILAFYNDLSAFHSRLNVVVMSEFGRRLRSNTSAGTDHGHGNVMMVLGGGVRGGRCYGKWPGLANHQLDEGADLAITTDYRQVLSEIATRKLGLKSAERVLPGYRYDKPLGLYA